MPTIDVAIPCYQYGRFLRNSVESVLDQGVDGLRLLIIDNASTDDSLEVARALADEDGRVEVVAHAVNLGQHASLNEAIDWASADYFVLLCADDVLAPGFLRSATAFMDRHPEVALGHGRIEFMTSEGYMHVPAVPKGADWTVKPGRDFIEEACRAATCKVCAPIIRTSAQKSAGHYRPELPHTDDVEMWLRIASFGDIAETDAALSVMRVHGSNRSNEIVKSPTGDLLHCKAAFDSFFAHEGAGIADSRRLRRLSRRSIGNRAYWSALAHLVEGHPGAARELIGIAFRNNPASAVLPPVAHLFKSAGSFRRIADVLSRSVLRSGHAAN